jgi:hypothetical protein
VLDTDGNITEIIPQELGFRRFEVKGGLMCLNGKRIVFRGVNRHDFNSRTGRVPDHRELERDIITMKRNNINAIRTSHYPNDSALYALCDRYGLYLIDETNMETHGSWALTSYTDLNKAPLTPDNPGILFGNEFDSYSKLNKKYSNQTTAKLFGDEFSATANLNLNIETKQVNVDLKLNEISKKAAGGIITAAGRSLAFAAGGMISAGSRASWWSSATKYASGTSRAHGTMFIAGEAGPEIVGHVNGRTEILNKSQLAQTMYSAVTGGMIAALRGITFTVPAMATGGIMPYEVSAQIARTGEDIQNTLNANNEDLIQTIISVAGQLVAAVGRIQPSQTGAGGATAQQVIDEINRRTLMFGASPLKGV